MSATIEKLLKRLEYLEAQMTIACDLKVSSEVRQHLLNELMVQHRSIAQQIVELRLREKLDGSEGLAKRVIGKFPHPPTGNR
ncbi:hypothetical protein KHC17_28545 (plasmid) [Agrobacterium salinitolerans]|uniref:hypothetical protein n=1 Tax=Agrobacterium salinitolerans TaxID=1183413 RepID=UPI001C228B1A|nr:hypothetical protein [Agrobacterium salinitolerans]QXC53050.1 hypothetical protein KHC17_28545 [Agrobacterium salinitolerans]